jgi:tetratricopeptide (TPR) repeat protein
MGAECLKALSWENEIRNGRSKMPMAAINRLALVRNGLSSFRGSAERLEPIGAGNGFYQFLVKAAHKNRNLSELGERLAVLAEHAYAFRRLDTLRELSRMLMNLPLPVQYEQVGRYYQALFMQLQGSRHLERTAELLQQIADNAAPFYRLRALQALGMNSVLMGDCQSALLQYRDVLRFSSREGVYNAPVSVSLQSNLAIIRSISGNHSDALALLQSIRPIAQSIRSARPHVYLSYLNSLAVELGAVGRLEEAERASSIVLRSPLAAAYPEWHETKEELATLRGLQASRSHIAFGHPLPITENPVSSNVVALQAFRLGVMTVGSSPRQLPREEGRILRFKCRKESMAKQSRNPNIAEQIRQMSHAERVIRLLELISSNDTTTDELAKILEIAESVAGKGKRQG